MSQFTPNTTASTRAGSRAPGRSNVYTLMLVIAFLALAIACAYVVFRHHELYGSWNPFDLPQAVAGVVSVLHAGLLGA